ncbi:protein FAM72A-like [Rhopilema esculentum]|uniref:protein FAM72A-like n=1 Tax=Rhopilema esculentum TaxID=499914 RepID=UPI0031CFEDD3
MARFSDEHSSFYEKTVIEIRCKFCDRSLSSRGMKANLIADVSVELYSTDSPQIVNILPVGCVRKAETCFCMVSDIACIGCGNIVGYHVTKPCTNCLSSCNNGHFWMFLSEASYQNELYDADVDRVKWEYLLDNTDGKNCAIGSIQRKYSDDCLR